ncbi:hypothetical protein CASFOL_018049 [Castilleja foliolosa]|uniref:Uncharacterized protein n=1 Tax=Castilleja foliolosa TaxID=1961234 RepID=A0ABD3DAD2_9LAMI
MSFPTTTDDFYEFLTKELSNLDNLFISENFMSMKFLQQVMSTLRSLHSRLTLLAKNLYLPAGGKWVDEYMDESSRLWEACTVLKPGVSNMKRYYKYADNIPTLVRNAVANPEVSYQVRGAIENCKTRMERLTERNETIIAEGRVNGLGLNFDPKYNNDTFDGCTGFIGVLYATKTATTLLLAILVSGLVYFCPETKTYFEAKYDEHWVFEPGYMGLTAKLHGRMADKIGMLESESDILVDELGKSMCSMDELLRGIKRSLVDEKVESVKSWFGMLKGGAEGIIEQIDDFFDEIVEFRKMVLGMCSHS